MHIYEESHPDSGLECRDLSLFYNESVLEAMRSIAEILTGA